MNHGHSEWQVRDLESDGQPVIGSYVHTVEDVVVYQDSSGRIRHAPEDCVAVERKAEA